MVNVFPVKILFKKIQSRNVLKWIEHILALQGDKWGGKLSKKSKISTENTFKKEGMYPHAYIHVCVHFKLFLALLGLCCGMWAFSSCDVQGLLFDAVHGFFVAVASLVVEHRL